MALPLVQDAPDESTYKNLADMLPVGTGEQVETTFASESRDAVYGKIEDMRQMSEADQRPGQRTLTTDELAEEYQGLNINWAGPQKQGVADIIADRKRVKMYEEAKIESGPDGYLNLGLRGGAAIMAHLVDPVELGANIASAGLFRVAAAATYGAAAIEGLGLAGRIGLGAAEGAIGQAVLEPVAAIHAKQFQDDYNSLTAVTNIGMGAITGGLMEGAGYGLGKAWDRFNGSPANKMAKHVAEVQAISGKKVDVEPIMRDFHAERSGIMPEGVVDYSGRTKYEFRPFEPGNPGGRKVYLGTTSKLEDLKSIDFTAHGSEGFVDHPLIANADAASKYNENVGNVIELTLSPEARILSTNQPLGDDGNQLLVNALKASDSPEASAALRAMESGKFAPATLNEALDAVPGLRAKLEPTLEAAGFHGLHLEDGEAGINRFEFFQGALENDGQPGRPKLFESQAAFEGDERLLGKLSEEEMADIQAKAMSPEQDELFNADLRKQAIEIEANGAKVAEDFDSFLDEKFTEMNETIASLEQDGVTLTPSDKAAIENFKKIDEGQKFGESMMKAAMNCLMG